MIPHMAKITLGAAGFPLCQEYPPNAIVAGALTPGVDAERFPSS